MAFILQLYEALCLCHNALENLRRGGGEKTKRRARKLYVVQRSSASHQQLMSHRVNFSHIASHPQLHALRLRAIPSTPNLLALHPAPRTITVIPTA